jgi:glycosyltransferase involved in cell wall biosynthesis
MDTLYIVVPCYNEEEVLPESSRIMRQKLLSLVSAGEVSDKSRLLLVDDGSSDSTWSIIERLSAENECIGGVKLSRNRGHQNALMAGLVTAVRNGADMTVSIDADLQDDINAVDEMVERYNAGCPIVCGVRRSRETDSFLKRTTARGYYALMNLCGAKIIYDHADFRLLSAGAVRELCRYGTEDLFIRGLITRLGLPIEKVRYDRLPRMAGESKYTLKKMLALAARGFTCRSMKQADTPQIGELYIEQVLLR